MKILKLERNCSTYRGVFKTRHGRLVYIMLEAKDDQFVIIDCYYIDRPKPYCPKKLLTKCCVKSELLKLVAQELDCTFYGLEIVEATTILSEKEFIQQELNQMIKGYKFLIFIGEGKQVNGMPTIIKTRFKNRIHRSIYLEIQYRNRKGVITDCHYYDRTYKEREKIIPETLSSVYFAYNRQAILNIVNNELNTAFTDIIFVTDGSLNIDKKTPLCGNI